MIKIKNYHIFSIGTEIICMDGKCLRSGLKWVEETSQFNEDFIKSYNEDSNIGYFL